MALREVYEDAIRTCDKSLYSQKQIDAWSALAYLPGILDKPLKQGVGWVSCVDKTIEAFALKYPHNRLALLYCRGRSSRQGHATTLLNQIEKDTFKMLSTRKFVKGCKNYNFASGEASRSIIIGQI